MMPKKKNEIEKAKKKVRKVPLGTGMLRKSVSDITKRDRKQAELLKKIGI